MRNLRLVQRTRRSLQAEALPLTATAWDTSTDSLICTFGPSESSAVIDLKRFSNKTNSEDDDFSLIASWDAPCPLPDLQCDKVLNLQYFPDTLTSCLVLAGGDIIIVRGEPLPGEDLIEIVGSVDAGITAAAWSPDEELLAITTRANTLLYMTRDFENVTNITFTAEDIKASNHVSVGWGKRETQFQGKRAKAMRDPTVPEHVDEGVLSSADDRRVSISWRGDGAYLAVNAIYEENRRMIRVYSREGVIDSVSEPVDYLEGALSWRPAGNLMAGIQRLQDRIDVVFFERNGLRHGQFSLRLTAEERDSWGGNIGLAWNNDSTVLAVSFKDRIQLWTMGNYHYYLKQEISLIRWCPNFEDVAEPVHVRWNPEKPLRLATVIPGALERLDYVFTVSKCSAAEPNDYGIVPVIDGQTVKITPLRLANVPPPMALHEVSLKGNAIDVAVNASSTVLATLHENVLCFYDYDPRTKPVPEPTIQTCMSLPVSPTYWKQLAFRGDSEVYTLYQDDLTEGNVICQTILGEDSCEMIDSGDREVHSIFSSVDYSTVCVLFGDGTVCPLDLQAFTIGNTICRFPRPPSWVEVIRHGDEEIAFGLTSGGMLYANERVLVKNCTSFQVTPAHLIFTTTQHLLKFVHLAPVHELEIPLDEPEKDERCRAIERGAKLVAVMPSSFSVTLQMPRGNLETIYPRALVVAGIRRSIEEKKYKTAFMACRNHRVDMNIIHDHAPEQFMADISLFIDQVKKVSHIDLFLSQLRDEDVTQTMYVETLKSKAGPSPAVNGTTPATITAAATGSKVNRICDAFLEVLQSRTATNLQNIITSHVCKSPPDLEGGLQIISKLREEDSDLAEKAAEHICFLADVNQLYDHALGLYDLETALLIAQQSQKDPREYLPYMQSLQEMAPLRRQFTIDDNLGRRTKALSHLHALSAFEELAAYTQKHTLYTSALALYKYDQPRLNDIMRLYASFLSSRNKFREAGVAYEYLSDHASALDSYRAASMWREALSSASTIPLPPAELSELATALADTAAETKDFAAAATITIDYLHDVEAAARLLCKGYFFAEALRLVALHGRAGDLVHSVVDPGLAEGSGHMTEFLADCKQQLAAQVPRLRELRVKKAEDPLAFFDGFGGGEGGADVPDNVSLAPTDTTGGATFMTRYTNRTGTVNTTSTRRTHKNRRREERKRARGKKGSVYEEEYLVNSIARLIERVNTTQEDVQRLVEGLMRRGMGERARVVEEGMREVGEACRACLDEVFGEEVKKRGVGEEEDVDGERPMGGEGVLWDAMEGAGRKERPVVKMFEGLSLLG
ncbi:elongator complex protein [Saccharata proteae CBS 121410]|uniref:Elongator complex protein 1 n=1 Tax=Saccharata proteae CBS 121410 TaxID=1314787 RepID=A0A9P4HQM6_9PEZI|nr:elongator complex protein [Saccharata proteae CBS 121410]